MKSLFIFTAMALFAGVVISQTQIAVTQHSEATVNHNQRKIVRDSWDNVYVVYTDVTDESVVIKGVQYDRDEEEWGDPFVITPGKNPTLAISQTDMIHLVYESPDDDPVIEHMSSEDFLDWSEPADLSDPGNASRLPLADVDSANRLNVFWIQEQVSSEALKYCCIENDSIVYASVITIRDQIYDVAIANHLEYEMNHLFFAVQFTWDSVGFFMSNDHMQSHDTLLLAPASSPCITFNSDYQWMYPQVNTRFLYFDHTLRIVEVEYWPELGGMTDRQLITEAADFVAIDNLAPPIGYSFIFMKNDVLYHGFSYGALWNWYSTMDTISPVAEISNPSIAYKKFNFEYIDMIWMDGADDNFAIYHKRDAKHQWMPGITDTETGKGFSINGYPNPFIEQLTIKVTVEVKDVIPGIEIYNTQSQLITTLNPTTAGERRYEFKWDGTNTMGDAVVPGIYIILCKVGDKATARKIVFE